MNGPDQASVRQQFLHQQHQQLQSQLSQQQQPTANQQGSITGSSATSLSIDLQNSFFNNHAMLNNQQQLQAAQSQLFQQAQYHQQHQQLLPQYHQLQSRPPQFQLSSAQQQQQQSIQQGSQSISEQLSQQQSITPNMQQTQAVQHQSFGLPMNRGGPMMTTQQSYMNAPAAAINEPRIQPTGQQQYLGVPNGNGRPIPLHNRQNSGLGMSPLVNTHTSQHPSAHLWNALSSSVNPSPRPSPVSLSPGTATSTPPRVQEVSRMRKDAFDQALERSLSGTGKVSRTPVVGGRQVDLYNLFYAVIEAGGFEKLTAEKKWKALSNSMGFDGTNVGSHMRKHYGSLLLALEQQLFPNINAKPAQVQTPQVYPPSHQVHHSQQPTTTAQPVQPTAGFQNPAAQPNLPQLPALGSPSNLQPRGVPHQSAMPSNLQFASHPMMQQTPNPPIHPQFASPYQQTPQQTTPQQVLFQPQQHISGQILRPPPQQQQSVASTYSQPPSMLPTPIQGLHTPQQQPFQSPQIQALRSPQVTAMASPAVQAAYAEGLSRRPSMAVQNQIGQPAIREPEAKAQEPNKQEDEDEEIVEEELGENETIMYVPLRRFVPQTSLGGWSYETLKEASGQGYVKLGKESCGIVQMAVLTREIVSGMPQHVSRALNQLVVISADRTCGILLSQNVELVEALIALGRGCIFELVEAAQARHEYAHKQGHRLKSEKRKRGVEDEIGVDASALGWAVSDADDEFPGSTEDDSEYDWKDREATKRAKRTRRARSRRRKRRGVDRVAVRKTYAELFDIQAREQGVDTHLYVGTPLPVLSGTLDVGRFVSEVGLCVGTIFRNLSFQDQNQAFLAENQEYIQFLVDCLRVAEMSEGASRWGGEEQGYEPGRLKEEHGHTSEEDEGGESTEDEDVKREKVPEEGKGDRTGHSVEDWTSPPKIATAEPDLTSHISKSTSGMLTSLQYSASPSQPALQMLMPIIKRKPGRPRKAEQLLIAQMRAASNAANASWSGGIAGTSARSTPGTAGTATPGRSDKSGPKNPSVQELVRPNLVADSTGQEKRRHESLSRTAPGATLVLECMGKLGGDVWNARTAIRKVDQLHVDELSMLNSPLQALEHRKNGLLALSNIGMHFRIPSIWVGQILVDMISDFLSDDCHDLYYVGPALDALAKIAVHADNRETVTQLERLELLIDRIAGLLPDGVENADGHLEGGDNEGRGLYPPILLKPGPNSTPHKNTFAGMDAPSTTMPLVTMLVRARTEELTTWLLSLIVLFTLTSLSDKLRMYVGSRRGTISLFLRIARAAHTVVTREWLPADFWVDAATVGAVEAQQAATAVGGRKPDELATALERWETMVDMSAHAMRTVVECSRAAGNRMVMTRFESTLMSWARTQWDLLETAQKVVVKTEAIVNQQRGINVGARHHHSTLANQQNRVEALGRMMARVNLLSQADMGRMAAECLFMIPGDL
ncbi:hypothetical protein BJ742DRAFT_793647 [Cladochytrium replicatum]|nr:hypothetical protein BJ742DRAFT_793647 [Cladochytrium replicatum]